MLKIGELPVTKVMERKFSRLKPSDPISQALKMFSKEKVATLPVFKGDRFVGQVDKLDLLKRVVDPKRVPKEDIIELGFDVDFGYFARKVSDVMLKESRTVDPSAKVKDVAYIMLEEGDSLIPVVDKGKTIGIVRPDNILKKMVK